MLNGVYDRVLNSELRPGSDHVTQVQKVEELMLVKKKALNHHHHNLSEPFRRLVCFCRLTEVADLNKKQDKKLHQRGVFLFNDCIAVTKSLKGSSKRNRLNRHEFRTSIPLAGIRINAFSTRDYEFGIQLQDRMTGFNVITFNARSQSDRQRLVADMQEAIAEMVEMEKAKMILNQDRSNSTSSSLSLPTMESFC